jgi:hypothetical protein
MVLPNIGASAYIAATHSRDLFPDVPYLGPDEAIADRFRWPWKAAFEIAYTQRIFVELPSNHIGNTNVVQGKEQDK